MKNENYFTVISLVERLHRLLMDVFRVELYRLKINDITNVQCFILHNIGHSQLTIGEISNRGYYLGSNVTYNLKQMVANEYLIQEQSSRDRRSSTIRASEKGLALYNRFEEVLQKHSHNLPLNGITDENVKSLMDSLQKLESFWSFVMSHGIRF